MALEITKNFTVQAPAAQVWDFLVDVNKVARCLPGAAITGRLDDRTYGGTMTVKVGPVQASYKGKVVFETLDASARKAEIVATGQDVRGRGGADLRLTSTVKEVAPGRTEVTAVSQVSITGILAQMGRGMIQDVSDQMFQLFSERMRTELESAPPPAAAPAAPPDASAAPTQPGAAVAPARQEALDLGSIGAKVAGRAAGRTLRRPGFWVALGIAIFVYLLFR
jgi:carbon monoxide dehydrogenase subunit G